MEPMLCIDFGNSYTKVALRKASTPHGMPSRDRALSEPLTDKSLIWDRQLYVCIPTMAAKTVDGPHPRYFYGSEVLQLGQSKLNSPSTKVFRNWKPLFFDTSIGRSPIVVDSGPPPDNTNHSVALSGDALENQYREWLIEYLGRGQSVAGIITFEQWKAAVLPLLGARLPVSRTTASRENEMASPSEIDQVAIGYFRWLREFVQDCVDHSRTTLQVADIATRITLPSFGNQSAAENRLVDILSRAGWRCAENAVVHEPFANAIGLFTSGRNVTWTPAQYHAECHYTEMFEGTPFYGEMRRVALLSAAQRADIQNFMYWILTVDIGGFTTDFSMIGMDTGDLVFFDESTEQTPARFSKHSVVAGVQDLDEAVVRCMPETKQAMLREMMGSADQAPLETFHTEVYGNLNAFSRGGLRVMETESEKSAILTQLSNHARHVCDALRDFMAIHQYSAVNELVLTGGGFNAPIVRDTVAKYVRDTYGARRFSLPLRADEKPTTVPVAECRAITPMTCRTATAVGGASVLFDELSND